MHEMLAKKTTELLKDLQDPVVKARHEAYAATIQELEACHQRLVNIQFDGVTELGTTISQIGTVVRMIVIYFK